jgi:hypothetical protein
LLLTATHDDFFFGIKTPENKNVSLKRTTSVPILSTYEGKAGVVLSHIFTHDPSFASFGNPN